MSYCKHGIEIQHILNMDITQLEDILANCENHCEDYHLCDTACTMLDELKYKNGECLKCPYCERYQDFSDCPDLFVDGDGYSPQEQVKLLHELWSKGYNIVTCGNCGEVFIHRTKGV